MTPFELWQAGRGPEPVVVAELPVMLASAKPWRWRHLRFMQARPGHWPPGAMAFALRCHKREEAGAAEECRAALERMVARESITDILEGLLFNETDTYCEFCQRHAPKHLGGPRDGIPCGPIVHDDHCPRLRAECLIQMERRQA